MPSASLANGRVHFRVTTDVTLATALRNKALNQRGGGFLPSSQQHLLKQTLRYHPEFHYTGWKRSYGLSPTYI